jgi:hypothetical protein
VIEFNQQHIKVSEESPGVYSLEIKNKGLPFYFSCDFSGRGKVKEYLINSTKETTVIHVVCYEPVNKKPAINLNGIKQLIDFKRQVKPVTEINSKQLKPWKKDRFYK